MLTHDPTNGQPSAPSENIVLAAADDPTAMQEHHLINRSNKKHEVLRETCFEIDNPNNILKLPATPEGAFLAGLAGHWGGHSAYNDLVAQKLRGIQNDPLAQDEAEKLRQIEELQRTLGNKLDRITGNCRQICLHSSDPNLGIYLDYFSKPIDQMSPEEIERARTIIREQLNDMPLDEALEIGKRLRDESLSGRDCKVESAAFSKEEAIGVGVGLGVGAALIFHPLFWDKHDDDDHDDHSGSGGTKIPTAANSNVQQELDIKKAAMTAAIMAAFVVMAKNTGPGRAALIVATLGTALTAEDAKALENDTRVVTPQEALPALREMQGSDVMGPRGEIDHITFKFTGYPPGDPHNTLAALKERDTHLPAGTQLNDNAAHMLIKADGHIEMSEQSGRPLNLNPQASAGHNGNAIAVYIEAYNPATRATLESLKDTLQQRVHEDGMNYPVSLLPAGTPERDAVQPAPQMGLGVAPVITQRPRLQQPSMGGGM